MSVTAMLDTCVLLKPYLCDSLLCLAEDGLFRPSWSGHILEELTRNLLKQGVTIDRAGHRLLQMQRSFPAALVTGYENLIPAMANDDKDRHVLAAAVRAQADVIVTENLRDFPTPALAPYDIAAITPDELLCDLLDLHGHPVMTALGRQVSRYRREPRTVDSLLGHLGSPGNACPDFARECRSFLPT